jgi:glycosyltransferase involved in cell wall biosynthesis
VVRAGSWRAPVRRLSAQRPRSLPDGVDDPDVQALFDARHYASVAGSRRGLAHYLDVGWRRGLDPHPLFSTRHYLAHSRDVVGAGMCPLVHYARHGASELRSPHPLFDAVHYADLGRRGWDRTVDPLRHYLTHAGCDGRQPNVWFDSDFYRHHSPDVVAAGVNPLVHYASAGWHEGRRPHPDFDVAHYLRTNPDVAATGVEPLAHFLRCGIRQGRSPSAGVDAVALATLVAATAGDRWPPEPEPLPPRRARTDGADVGPALSVVVGTSGAVDTLPAVLAALEAQTAGREDFEVIVVADAADDALRAWADEPSRRIVVHPGAGSAGRRNLGLFVAAAPIVLFLADDERADPDLITQHRRAHDRYPQVEVAVVGRTTWDEEVASTPLATWTTLADDVPLGYPGNPRVAAPDRGHTPAPPQSVKRSLHVRRGAVDPTVERFGDVELAIRLQLAGLDLRAWPAARSSRVGPCDLDALCAEMVADGPELVRLAAVDPSGLVGDLCAVTGASMIWRRAADTFERDRAAARAAEVDGGEPRELFARYHDLLWASRARGIASALAAPSTAPAAERPLTCARRDPVRVGGPRPRVLVAGVVLADRPNTAVASSRELAASRHYAVEQRWIVVGRARPRFPRRAALPERHIAVRRSTLAPKYELLGDLLAEADPGSYDHVLLVDDDVDLPAGFLDAFLDIQRALGFVLAQPARAPGSPADHPIVLQQPGSLARRTLFVEQGPVLSIQRDALLAILPFDLRSPMGWGYESIWSHRLGMDAAMGIVDATTVAHRLRPTAALYAKAAGEVASATLLDAVGHRPLDECMRILEVHPLDARDA